MTWYLPIVRRLLLSWQRRVNGFELRGQDTSSHDLVFRCTHYDPVGKRCDSYASRPGMCRDYPHFLLGQPWPELFETCGYRVHVRKPEGLRASIEATSLSPEAKAELCRKLRLS
jgi:Fe-S-cluster containining protein